MAATLLSRDNQGGGVAPEVYERAYGQAREAQEDRARRREEMAESQVREFERRAQLAREEADHARQSAEAVREEARRQIQDASRAGDNILTALIPTFNESANQQVQQTIAAFQAREQRIEADHAKAMANEQRSQDMALERAEQQRSAEMARLEAMYQSMVGTAHAELAALRVQLEGERNQSNSLREEIRKLHMEQISAYQKDNDPIAALGKYQAVADFAREVLPQQSTGDEPGGLSPDAPDYMKLLAHATQTLGPAINQAIQMKQEAGQQPPQQQLTPEQAAYLQQMEQQKQQQAIIQAQQQPPPAVRVQIDQGELQKALDLLASVKNSGTEPSDAATAAMSHGDQRVLREISSRPPAKLIEELDRHGMLPNELTSEEGREYLMEVLKHLKTLTHAPGVAK